MTSRRIWQCNLIVKWLEYGTLCTTTRNWSSGEPDQSKIHTSQTLIQSLTTLT